MRLDEQTRREFAELSVTIDDGGDDEEDCGDEDEERVAVWDVSWRSLVAFLDCDTQWRIVVAGFGGAARLGLDYAGVDALLRRRGLPDDAFEDLIAMERAALEAFASIERD